MEFHLRKCGACNVKFPCSWFYTIDGDLIDICHGSLYGTRQYNEDETYWLTINLPQELKDVVSKKIDEMKEASQNTYYDKTNLYPK